MHGSFLHTTKIFLAAAALALFVIALASLGDFSADPARAASDDNVSGFAWSDNIGWISFNCANFGDGGCGVNYGVNVGDPDEEGVRILSGYAWSDAIGWITFSPASGYPESPNHGARLEADGAVTGWARACGVFANDATCSGSLKNSIYLGGWDGWIKMSGANHPSPQADGTGGVTVIDSDGDNALDRFVGFAWGGEPLVGWMSMSGASPSYAVLFDAPPVIVEAEVLAPEVSLIAPESVLEGTNAVILWEARNATSCVGTDTNASDGADNDWWADGGGALSGGDGAGSLSVGPVNGAVTYTLTCANTEGSQGSAAVSINIDPFIVSFSASPTKVFSGSGATSVLSWDTANFDATDSCRGSSNPSDSNWDDGGAGKPLSCGSASCGEVGPWNAAGTKRYTLTCTRASDSLSASKGTSVQVVTPDFFLEANPSKIDITSIGQEGVGTGGSSEKATISVQAVAAFGDNIALSVISDPFSALNLGEGAYHYYFAPAGVSPGSETITLSKADGQYPGTEFWLESTVPLPAQTSNIIRVQGVGDVGGVTRFVEIDLNSRLFDPVYREF